MIAGRENEYFILSIYVIRAICPIPLFFRESLTQIYYSTSIKLAPAKIAAAREKNLYFTFIAVCSGILNCFRSLIS